MTVVRIAGPLRPLTRGLAEVAGRGGTVGDVLLDVESRFPGFLDSLCDASGRPRPFLNVYVNDQDVRLDGGLSAAVGQDDDILIVPAVAGG